jgi:hypothetical protein
MSSRFILEWIPTIRSGRSAFLGDRRPPSTPGGAERCVERGHPDAEALMPTVLFATQPKQHYNLGDLRDTDQVAASVIDLGQLIATRGQVGHGHGHNDNSAAKALGISVNIVGTHIRSASPRSRT